MAGRDWAAFSAVSGFAAVTLACFGTLALRHGAQPEPPLRVQLPAVEIAGRMEPRPDREFERLRAQMRWVPTKIGREIMPALDFESRMLLAKAAARRVGLAEVGLSYKDVYAIINAETSWAPRRGESRDGTPNLGIAQFEPATARALGLRNPDDPVEAVHAAALHIKEAALWSRERVRRLRVGKDERAEKLREGISVYYNLSTRGRNQWNGMNTATLPTAAHRQCARRCPGGGNARRATAREVMVPRA
jgi:hypothetical protein